MPEEAEEKSPFDPYVQELQAQEGDIGRKVEIIEGILEGLNLPANDPIRQDLEARLKQARNAFKDRQKRIARRKVEDLEKELEVLDGAIQDPGKINPQPPPPWVWPWPWPPPPGFPGPGGTGTPGVINVGIVEVPQGGRHEVALTERDFITARSKTEVWVWNPAAESWEAHLDTVGEIVALEKVDGTIAVWTATALWLFHPLKYAWLGPLTTEIEEVKAINLAFPTVVAKT